MRDSMLAIEYTIRHSKIWRSDTSALQPCSRLVRTGCRELVKATLEKWRARVRERRTWAATGAFAAPGAKGEPTDLEDENLHM